MSPDGDGGCGSIVKSKVSFNEIQKIRKDKLERW